MSKTLISFAAGAAGALLVAAIETLRPTRRHGPAPARTIRLAEGAALPTCATCGAVVRPASPPEGHVKVDVIRFQSGAHLYYLARCECGWNERTISELGAEGALTEHLVLARPWAKWDPAEFDRLQAELVARRLGVSVDKVASGTDIHLQPPPDEVVPGAE